MPEDQNQQPAASAAELAYRTLEYVSSYGKEPEEAMECDVEMWKLAHEILRQLGREIPKRQKTSRAWAKEIARAKAVEASVLAV